MGAKELIQNFLVDRLGVDPEKIVDDAVLADLGVDSLMLVEMFFEAEDKFKLSIPSDVPTPTTVGEITGLIQRFLSGQETKA